jgi:hypothetical protein
MRLVTRIAVIVGFAGLLGGDVAAQYTERVRQNERIRQVITRSVNEAIKSLGASLLLDSVYVSPDPENVTVSMPDVVVRIDVKRQDCNAVDAMAKTKVAVAKALSVAQDVRGVKFVTVFAVTQKDANPRLIDRHDTTIEGLLQLLDGKRHRALYASAENALPAQSLPYRDSALVETCTQMLCAPNADGICTVRSYQRDASRRAKP